MDINKIMCTVSVKVNGDVLRGEAIDIETFRADLHRMVEKVYAEP